MPVPSITNDFTSFENADAITNWTPDNAFKNVTANTTGQIQGTGCIQSRIQNVGAGQCHANPGGTFDMTGPGVHLYAWVRESFAMDTTANNGWGLGLGTDAPTTAITQYGKWTGVAGSDRGVPAYDSWKNIVVNLQEPYDLSQVTVPLQDVVNTVQIDATFLDNGRDVAVLDEIKFGSLFTAIGGTTGTPGTLADIAALDKTAGDGLFKKLVETYFLASGMILGDVANVECVFRDTNKVIVIENWRVSGSLYRIQFVGHATPTTEVSWGTASGSGVDREAQSGVTIFAAGAQPFHLSADDANCTVNFHGCNFVGPSVAYDSPIGQFIRDDNGVFTDLTTHIAGNARLATSTDLFPVTPAVGDTINFGQGEKFDDLYLDLGVAGAGSPTIIWEYSTGGTSFSALTDLADTTANLLELQTATAGTITFAIPGDWAEGTVNSITQFWIRARISSGAFTTSPTITNGAIQHCRTNQTGQVNLGHTNIESIRTNYTNMGTIRVRSADFKKCVISDSLAPAKSAAVDFGAADPAVDTVRDLTITGGINHVLLKGSGNTTYNLRNINMSGESGKKVRVDFGGSDTVTINILDGGTSLIAGDIDNVNTSTVVINNATVTTLVNVKDSSAANLQNARVFLEAADGAGDLTFEVVVTITRSGSTASVAHTAHGMVNGNKVVIRGAVQQEYNGVFAISNVTTNAYDYTVSGTPTTPATGTITESGVILEGLTDASGNISDTRTITTDTALKGFCRKASASPRFKSFTLAGTTDNLVGLTINIRMILDE